jgi:RNA polymerase sigma-70 factor, ECF subfamily
MEMVMKKLDHVEVPLREAQPNSAAALSRTARFEKEVLPLRAELERAARRHTRNVIDAQDLVQETFVKAWAAYDSFDPGSNARAWMHRIMVNAWISAYRRAERRPQESLVGSFTDPDLAVDSRRSPTHPSAEEYALEWWPNSVIRQAIQTLPKTMQRAVYYADVCQYTYTEIAQMDNVPAGTVMSRIHRGRARLRVALSDFARQNGYAEGDPRDIAA